MSTIADPLTLTGDELRVIGITANVALPPLLSTDWDPSDVAIADRVATRGLLARGLLESRPGCTAMTTGARQRLQPLLRSETVIEMEAGDRRCVVIGDPFRTLLLDEVAPDVWLAVSSVLTTVDVALWMIDDVTPAPGGSLRAVRSWGPTLVVNDGLAWSPNEAGAVTMSEGNRSEAAAIVDPAALLASLRDLLEALDAPPRPGPRCPPRARSHPPDRGSTDHDVDQETDR